MKNSIFIIVLFFTISCNPVDKKLQLARDAFKGFEEIIPNLEIIQELKPDEINAKSIKIPDNSKNIPLLMDELIDSMFYVKLENNNQASIEAIDKVLFIENRIIVYDKQKKRGLYLFSRKGKFLSRIGEFGKGPEKYLYISDVAINKMAKRIVVLDEYGKCILYYDTNGKFVKKDKIYYFSKDFAILDDGSFVFYQLAGVNAHLEHLKNYSLLLSSDGQSITNYSFSSLYRNNLPLLTFGRATDLVSSTEFTLLNPYLTNNIYQIKKSNQITLKYKLDLGKTDIHYKMNKQTNNEEYLKLINTNEYLHFDGEMLETNQNLYFKYGNNNYCFYNSITNNLKCGDSFGYTIRNNTSPHICFNPPIAVNRNWFVSVIWPYEISKNQEEFIRLTNDSTYGIFKNITPLDNPILLFFTLKKF